MESIGIKPSEVKTGQRVNYYAWKGDNGELPVPIQTEIISDLVWSAGGGNLCKIQGICGGVSLTHLELIK